MKKIFLLIFMLNMTAVFAQQYVIKNAFTNYTFNRPVEMIPSMDNSNRIFILEQRGKIFVFKNDSTVNNKKLFVDLTQVAQSGYEGGLMAMAFHPNFKNNRYFYVNYSFDSVSKFWTRISRFTVSATNPDSAVKNSENIILTISHPYGGHKGGRIQFGSDGYLYIAVGDGGSNGDPLGNGQSKSTLLGKILRINVNSTSPGKNYSVPASNPFYGNNQGYKEEIYAYGLRNPWKFSFDYQTGKLWAGDVGEFSYEEIDIIENGKNYGWNKMEGFHCYGTCDTTGKGFTRPVWEFYREIEHAVIGGYVYRGLTMPGLYGKYLYADLKGYVYAITYNGSVVTSNVLLHDYFGWAFSALGLTEDNEMYIVGYYTGILYRLVNKNLLNVKLKMLEEGYFNSNKLAMKDSVEVSLRSSVSPYAIGGTSKAVIDSLTFTGNYNFENTNSGSYYMQIKHRNSIETWSKLVNLTTNIVNNFDLTSAQNQAYGSNLKLKNGYYCIYSGDVNQNGIIDLTDVSQISNSAINYTTGYVTSDLNGDKFVDVADLSIVENNAINIVMKITP